MVEKEKLVVRRLSYEGFFNYKELFRIMDFWLREKFYDKFEKRSEEFVTPTGKQVDFEFTPWKKVTDYYKIILKIEVIGQHLKEVEVVVNNEKKRMHHGKINIKITGYLVVDYEGYWDKTSFHTFIRDIFDRYIYWYITKKYQNMVIDHTNDLFYTLSTYLNVTKYKEQT